MDIKKLFKKSRKFYFLSLLLLIFTVPLALSGCGGGGGSSGTSSPSPTGSTYTVSGTVTGGSYGPISGATVNLYLVGNPSTMVASCGTTSSTGGFSCSYTPSTTPSATPVFYVLVNGLPSGYGNNTLYGVSSGSNSSLPINELTTAEAADAFSEAGGSISSKDVVSISNATNAYNDLTTIDGYVTTYQSNPTATTLTSNNNAGLNAAIEVLGLATGLESCIQSTSYCSSVTALVPSYTPGSGSLLVDLAGTYSTPSSTVPATLYNVNAEMSPTNAGVFPVTYASLTSSASASGGFGAFTNLSGEAELAAPTSGGGYLVTFPTTGAYSIAATVSTAQFTPINLPIFKANNIPMNGSGVDTADNIGVAYSYNSNYIPFFYLTGTNAGYQYGDSSSNLTSTVGYYTCGTNASCAGTLGFSGATPTIGGVVMDPASEVAIASTYGGYDIINYAPLLSTTPSAPVHVMTIPSYASTEALSTPLSYGIGMVENFAFDPNLTIGSTTYQAILGDAGSEGSAFGYPNTGDGNILEIAVFNPSAKTYTIYKPDPATQTTITSVLKADGVSTLPPEVDQIAIDTGYQIAVLGDENQYHTILINLNDLTLTPPSSPTSASQTDGTYSLPANAIYAYENAGSGTSYFGLDNVAVESTNHIVMIGSGGFEGLNLTELMVGQLENPSSTSCPAATAAAPSNGVNGSCLGFTSASYVTMPDYGYTASGVTQSNIDSCNGTGLGCSSISSPAGQTWDAWGDPHEIGAFSPIVSSGSSPSYALWGSNSENFIGVLNLTELLANPTAYYDTTTSAYNVIYQEIPPGS